MSNRKKTNAYWMSAVAFFLTFIFFILAPLVVNCSANSSSSRGASRYFFGSLFATDEESC